MTALDHLIAQLAGAFFAPLAVLVAASLVRSLRRRELRRRERALERYLAHALLRPFT